MVSSFPFHSKYYCDDLSEKESKGFPSLFLDNEGSKL